MPQPALHRPRRSGVGTISLRPVPGDIHPQWQATADRKGFTIKARVTDRYHLSLECQSCGALNQQRIYTLMTAMPLCQACLEGRWMAEARSAGIQWLGRDPKRRHYGRYRLNCGHDASRQFALIQRVARGETDLRCEICLRARETETARQLGWTLLGPAPSGRAGYRQYRHERCGHIQEIACTNIQTRRFGCGSCDPGWCAAPSWIYLLGLDLPDGRRWVKVGISRDPESRSRHQLGLADGVICTVLTQVRRSSGQVALRAEKALHHALRRAYSEAVISRPELAPWVNVVSEIYAGWMEGEIRTRLDAIAVATPGT